MTGLVIEDQEDQTGVKVRIGPGEQKIIKLTTTSGEFTFASTSSCLIEDV